MLEIIFKDSEFCVINKPAGSVVHKTPGAEKSLILLQALRDQLGKTIYPVHRLDNGTSGCLVFAFSSKAAASLQRALQDTSSVKSYIALMRGQPPVRGVYDRPLTSEKGVIQPAVTRFQLKQQFDEVALVDLEIETGRRHQIRRHAAHAGHHVVGDVNYGKGWLNRRFREKYDFYRMFLHCQRLSFELPGKNEKVDVQCPLDEELQRLVERLGQESL